MSSLNYLPYCYHYLMKRNALKIIILHKICLNIHCIKETLSLLEEKTPKKNYKTNSFKLIETHLQKGMFANTHGAELILHLFGLWILSGSLSSILLQYSPNTCWRISK